MSPTTPLEPESKWRLVNLPAIVLIQIYRVTLSPFVGGHCRFIPTCSQYALDAYRGQNPIRATLLVARRLARCHPWGGGGYDPAPPAGPPPESPESRDRVHKAC